MSFYDDMANMASGLLQEFDQGGLALMKQVPGNGPAHNPGPSTWIEMPFTGIARGVTGEHLRDTLIKSSDLFVIMPGSASPDMADKVKVNGSLHSIAKITPKPAAGIPSIYEVVVRK